MRPTVFSLLNHPYFQKPVQDSNEHLLRQIEDFFLPLDLYKGLKCQKVVNEQLFENFQNWANFSNKYAISEATLTGEYSSYFNM